ncbi:MAG: tetratricopeptide repeat protein [Flavobacteriales bacterium]|nr:tetratricopeptide repeat protein [Flavobacteriales bacterium]
MYIKIKKITLIICIFFLGNAGFAQAGDLGQMMFERANYLYQNQKFDSALFYINNAIKAQPNTESYIFRRALIYEKVNKPDDAISDYKTCISITDKALYYNNIGVIYAIQSDFNEALKWYQIALEKEPEYAQSWVNIGVAYYYLKMPEKACDAMRNASKYGLKMADSYLAEHCK